MSNPNAPDLNSIELQNLVATDFDLSSADVVLAISAPGIQHPQLVLEGAEDAFEHSYTNGRLVVSERDNAADTSGGIIMGNRGIVFGNGGLQVNHFVGNNVHIGGGVFFGNGAAVTVGGEARRKALLRIPEDHTIIDHTFKTVSGNASLEAVSAQKLHVSSISGNIALRGAQVEMADFRTVSGIIRLADVCAIHPVTLQSVSGGIDIAGGSAPAWNLTTISGRITARGAQGPVDASSVSGRVRVE